MNNLWDRLRAALLFWRKFPVVVLPQGYWTPDDAKSLSNWLGTETGAKFRHLRWNAVYESQLKAIIDRRDSAYSAGTAFGMRSMIAFEDSLLQLPLGESDSLQSTGETSGGFNSVNR